jgi:hypothetical protein
MILLRSPMPCLLAILMAGLSAPVFAAPPGRPPVVTSPRDMPSPRNDDALSDSVRRVERATRAQVLSAERVPYDGRDVNRIKTIDDRGRVRVFMDDPAVTRSPQDPPTHGNDD